MSNAKYHSKCPISGNHDLIPFAGYERHDLVKSPKSGFVFCRKIPQPQDLIDYYNRYNREIIKPEITIKRYHEWLDGFEKYRKTNKILDIGCGTGIFLELAKKKGWEVFGVELNKKAFERSEQKGIKMHYGQINDCSFPQDYFDVIISIEVIEHINNPVEEIKIIHSILRKKGLFFLTTPNFNAFERFILKNNYPVISYPEHLCYYTPKTIYYLLITNGFKKKFIQTTGISINQLKNHFFYPIHKNKSEGNNDVDFKIREQLERNYFLSILKKSINIILNIFRIGNKIKAGFEKY